MQLEECFLRSQCIPFVYFHLVYLTKRHGHWQRALDILNVRLLQKHPFFAALQTLLQKRNIFNGRMVRAEELPQRKKKNQR